MSNCRYTTVHSKAFTLIETVLYLALFSIIIGGLIVSCFTLLEYKDNNETSTLIASDAQNILSKIDFYFSGTNNVFFPRQNTSCQGSLCVLTVENISPPIQRTISYSDNSLFIAEGGGGQRKISGLPVSAFSVDHFVNAYKTSVVSISFTLQATSSLGISMSQDFHTNYYVRK